MEKEKGIDFEQENSREDYDTETSSRARNRTVMLTPEITSQVRSRFQQEMEQLPSPNGSPARANNGFESPRTASPVDTGVDGFYAPAATHQPVRARLDAPAPAPVAPSYAAAPPVASNSAEYITWVKESPVIAFLVAYDVDPNGSVFMLRSGRLIVTNHPASGESCLVLNHDSVSSMHAIIRISGSGEIQLLDQLSEYGTKIKRFGSQEEESLCGEKTTVDHGDIVSFGSRQFHVCVVPRS